MNRRLFFFLSLFLILLLGGCQKGAPGTPPAVDVTLPVVETALPTLQPAPSVQPPTATQPDPTLPPSPTTQPSPPTQPVPTAQLQPTVTIPVNDCRIGLGLRRETIDLALKYKDHPALIMTSGTDLAREVFPQLPGWIRTLGAPSLAVLERSSLAAAKLNLPYEGLSYGLETGKSTPQDEWHNLVSATGQAQELAHKAGKILVMGPGFGLMSDNEDKYGDMAALADVWVFQTQRLQIDPPGDKYRQGVERVVNLIRAGNPDVKIWAQITLPPDREANAEEWLAYRSSINDLVDGTYLGVYTWGIADNAKLLSAMDTIFATACGGQ